MSKENTTNEIVLSDDTKKIISLKKDIDSLYDHILDVLVNVYASDGEGIGRAIFNNRFSKKIESLDDEVNDLLIDFINQDVAETNNR